MYRFGTSGWYYDEWAGIFYPEDLDKSNWLEYYSKRFDAVEVNASFYRLPFKNMIKGWDRRTEDDFMFVFKGSRLVTHRKRLKGVKDQLDRFYDRISMIKEKTGAILWQLPPGIKRDDDLLSDFMEDLNVDYRNVIEFRDRSWFEDDVFDLMRDQNVSYCIVDCPDLPTVMETTSDLSYLRFHGNDSWYSHDYSDQELGGWATKIKSLDSSDVFCFFNNDQGGYAPKNCKTLREIVEK